MLRILRAHTYIDREIGFLLYALTMSWPTQNEIPRQYTKDVHAIECVCVCVR